MGGAGHGGDEQSQDHRGKYYITEPYKERTPAGPFIKGGGGRPGVAALFSEWLINVEDGGGG